MKKGKVTKQEVLRRMLDLATGGANDTVKLSYLGEEDREEIAKLDLRCLAEFKRHANGAVEVKLTDRAEIFQRILDQLEEEMRPAASRKGRLATFELKILFRQHASWQGTIVWKEGRQEQSFRSVLELVHLMDSALRATEEDGVA